MDYTRPPPRHVPIWHTITVDDTKKVRAISKIAKTCSVYYIIQLGGTNCSLEQFWLDYIMNDLLGMIWNAHMALADEFSPSHPECIQLASLASQAVDFSKTGIPVERDFTRPSAYPDFMGKEVIHVLFCRFLKLQ